ncbi:MAG TPA: prepilin-type N-terminal cleavage/methylation domain-containing protein [Syntrophorhabdaceae bacterium]|nr:prepilin-type N-terminal cleavage/methylation domain-containing protein [Syntrophorhabdaceae bacterium]
MKRQGLKGLIGGANCSTSNQTNPRNFLFHSKGFTLIELIIFIIIAGIFLPATYVAFSSSMRSATQPEDLTRARLLAEEVMELATKRGFSQLSKDIASVPTCGTIGATVPSGYNCTYTPEFRSFDGSGFTSGTKDYIQIDVSITTPQGNTFKSTGMVTSHVY